MASRILYALSQSQIVEKTPSLILTEGGTSIKDVPAVLFSNGSPWLEACAYLAQRAGNKNADGSSIEAVRSESWHLRAYAEFLETHALSWCDFPLREADRPTKQFRGFLIRQRREQLIKPTTASNRISTVKRFYQWALEKRLLADGATPFTPKSVKISYRDRRGLPRSVSVMSSDLSIPNRTGHSEGVEDGLFPLQISQRDGLLKLAPDVVHPEFLLMLRLGFFSGMRIGTITGLTRTAIRNAFPSPDIATWQSIEVGPRAGIPTKGNVDYFASMPPWLLNDLREYARSFRALERRAKASPEDHDLLFHKRDGGRYTNTTSREEMAKLRRMGNASDLGVGKFKFHCTRATFGTSVAVAYLRHSSLPSDQVLNKLMRLMGHTTVQSSLRYLKFIEQAEEDNKLTEDYAAFLLGTKPYGD